MTIKLIFYTLSVAILMTAAGTTATENTAICQDGQSCPCTDNQPCLTLGWDIVGPCYKPGQEHCSKRMSQRVPIIKHGICRCDQCIPHSENLCGKDKPCMCTPGKPCWIFSWIGKCPKGVQCFWAGQPQIQQGACHAGTNGYQCIADDSHKPINVPYNLVEEYEKLVTNEE